MRPDPHWHIQIHLMLIFITDRIDDTTKAKHSNTSHVNLYHVSLIVIRVGDEFKYISC